MISILKEIIKKYKLVAVILMIATNFMSCKKRDNIIGPVDIDTLPRQTIKNMRAIQTHNGLVAMRIEADLMESYSNDTVSYEIFPKGFNVFGYTKDGNLETKIQSDKAKHTKKGDEEKWEAMGNVVIYNFIKGERMETDTLYWDRYNHKIYTHTFVKLFSPQGYMQGFGMESDDMAKNAVILRPFDSYGIIEQDSTKPRYIDTVNFIGPIIKK